MPIPAIPAILSLLLALPAREKITDTTIRNVLTAGEGGVHTYRIPAVVLSPRGHVLVFAEARKESISDASPTDMVLRRSTDGGLTWLPVQTLARGVGTDAIMNPVALTDRRTGRVLLMYCQTNRKERGEHRRHFLISSKDDGLTWSKPTEMGSSIRGYDDTFVPGPGCGIQTSSGRLVVPGYTSEDLPDFKTEKGMHARVIYSDDGGSSWQMGAAVDIHSNESQVVELQDGRLMLNMRQAMGEGCRAVAVSNNGGAGWGPVRYDRQLNETPCQASILRHSLAAADGKNMLLFANPDNAGQAFGATDRTRMTVRISFDEGLSWPVKKLIHAGPSSYSGLVRFPDGDVGLVFEGGEQHRREWIRFARMPLSWLTAE